MHVSHMEDLDDSKMVRIQASCFDLTDGNLFTVLLQFHSLYLKIIHVMLKGISCDSIFSAILGGLSPCFFTRVREC